MISSLNDLRIVPLERLILHEAHDPSRLARLCERMEAEGVQRNPVIVSPHGEDYLVLDGAHRIQALRGLGCKLALVQMTEPPEAAESWGHVLEEDRLSGIDTIEEVEVSGKGRWLARVESGEGDELFLRARGEGLAAEVEALWGLQPMYPEGVVHRVDSEAPVRLEAGEAVIRYRPFTPRELVEVVGLGKVLPAGITRFRVSERVLGVRFPLEKLRDGEPEERGAELEALVRRLWDENRIRYYG
ncbi:MAG: ParB N-terminal domain-containing protein, partial [Actinomycetota bacterium]|nr:ParB N-terminal domain-containing protein [Actinomycetota bacterium]